MSNSTTIALDQDTVDLLDEFVKRQPIKPTRSAVARVAIKEFCKGEK